MLDIEVKLLQYQMNYRGVIITHHPSSCVVVQVDSSPGVLSCLLRVHVLFGNPFSEIHVVTAATPQPATTACTQNIT